MNYIGLADCNSFYASCERVFRPDLAGRPIVVLSNNDGCIVALSKEAKLIGIERGTPYFKAKELIEKCNVAVFSSNYTLYQNLSDRVMELLRILTGDIEIYSIDECFFHPQNLKSLDNADKYIESIAKYLRQGIGIPVSVGFARTKTLAKIANHVAKKNKLSFVLKEENEKEILKKTPIDDIWGIGWRSVPKLKSMGITNAWEFANLDDDILLKKFTVCGYNTAMELRGKQMIGRETPANLSVSSSISFSSPEKSFENLQKALACHCTTVCDKLYACNHKAQSFGVQLLTNRFHEDFRNSFGSIKLENPSYYVPDVLSECQKILRAIYERNIDYKSMRVIAWDLVKNSCTQGSLFSTQKDEQLNAKKESLNRTVHENKSLYCGTTASSKKQDLANRKMLSPLYTTNWLTLAGVGRSDSKNFLL